MKKVCYLLLTALLLFVTSAMAQLPVKKMDNVPGIKSVRVKISELKMQQNNEPNPGKIKEVKEMPLRSSLTTFKKLNEIINNRRHQSLKAPDEGSNGEEQPMQVPILSSNTGPETIWSNFLASTFNEAIGVPPDPNGDVGPSQVVAMMNAGIKVFEKRGVTDPPLTTPSGTSDKEPKAQLFIPLDNFFSPVLPSGSYTSDPHVRYDRLSKRWFIDAIEVNESFENNFVFLAVSDGDRITDSSSFNYFAFPSAIFPFDPNVSFLPFLDFPSLGVDKNSVLIGGDAFFDDSINTVAYIIDKKGLINGQIGGAIAVVGSYDFNTGNSWGMYAPQGAQNGDAKAPKSFFAGVSFHQFGFEPLPYGEINLVTIGYNAHNIPNSFSETSFKVDRFNFPRVITAPGSLIFIDPNDTKLLNAAIYTNKFTKKASLWTAHAIGVNQWGNYVPDSVFNNEARTASRFYEFADIYTGPTIKQHGTLFDNTQSNGRKAVNFFDPSIASNGQGQALLGGTTASFMQYLNVFIAGHNYKASAGSLSSPQKATTTGAIYDLFSPRWGDFSQTVVDPEDDQTMWTFQEYTATDGNFGVRAVQIKAPPPATPMPVGTLSNGRDTTVSIIGVSVNNSGFFDPGNDTAGPGYNRLTVKTTGGITADVVSFINPTKFRLHLNIKNKTPGTYTLVITNPDGQVVTTDFTLISSSSLVTQHSLNNTLTNLINTTTIYPNPTSGEVTMAIDAVKAAKGNILLLDVNGKKMLERNLTLNKGTNETTLSLAGLSNGTYIAAIYDANNVLIATHVVVKQ